MFHFNESAVLAISFSTVAFMLFKATHKNIQQSYADYKQNIIEQVERAKKILSDSEIRLVQVKEEQQSLQNHINKIKQETQNQIIKMHNQCKQQITDEKETFYIKLEQAKKHLEQSEIKNQIHTRLELLIQDTVDNYLKQNKSQPLSKNKIYDIIEKNI